MTHFLRFVALAFAFAALIPFAAHAQPQRPILIDLVYASLPAERLRTAPPARPGVNGMTESLLTVRLPFEQQDLAAGRESFACHRTQYTPAEMDAINRYLAHAWNGMVWLRPWNGALRDPRVFERQ